MIFMGILTSKLRITKYNVMKWQNRAGGITNNSKMKVSFYLPYFRATNIITCKFLLGDSTEISYDTIEGRDILISVGLNLKSSITSYKEVMDRF